MTIDSTSIPRAPLWVSWARGTCQALPRGRFRFLHALKSARQRPFWSTAAPFVGGFQFVCHLGDAIAREVCFTGRYEPQETFLLDQLLSPGDTFVDVGANWGYFSLMAAARVGSSGRVVSLEPHPRLVALLRANLARNDFTWATVVDTAVAATHGTMTFNGFDPSGDKWGTSRLSGSDKNSDAFSFDVPIAPLDDILDSVGVDRVDLLKMDIEGAEALAIQGMHRGLDAGRYPRILLELHPDYIKGHGTTADHLLAEFLNAGYRAWRLDHSPGMTHRAAYANKVELPDFIQPLDGVQPLDVWPHLFLSTEPVPELAGCHSALPIRIAN